MLPTEDTSGGAAVYREVSVGSRIAAGAAVLAAILVSIAAMLPAEHFGAIHSGGVLHPYFHVAIFGLIAWLTAWSTRSTAMRVALCGAVILLGCATEITEHVLYHSTLEWTDMVLDAMGAVAGTGLGALTASRDRSRG